MDLATIRFDYTSLRGEKTRRTVDVKAFSEKGFDGHCYLRDKWRPFKFHSIKDCNDIATGEFLPDPFSYLVDKLRDYQCKNSAEELDKFLFLEHNFFLILVYIGRQSGQLAKRKKEVIINACNELHGSSLISSPLDLDFLSNGFSFFNTKEEFEKAISDITKHNDTNRQQLLIDAAKKIVKVVTNGAVREQAVLEYILSKFTCL